jgi:transposase
LVGVEPLEAALVGPSTTAVANGESIRAIARRFGRSYGYARNLLLDAGVELRPSGRQPRPHQQQRQ